MNLTVFCGMNLVSESNSDESFFLDTGLSGGAFNYLGGGAVGGKGEGGAFCPGLL